MSKITKPFASAAAILLILFVITVAITSCGTPKDGVLIPVPKDTSALSKIDHHINAAQIKQFRRSFNTERDSLKIKYPDLFITESEGFNKPALLELLKDPKCVGLRIYYGVTKGANQKELKMIIVGTDSQGKDLLIEKSAAAADVTQEGYGLEYGQCCVGSNNDQ